ncbi:HTH-type transcriptional repressor CzrA [Actinomadura rubteroloni]|uniref:HTH-type transcriptional repressor CzrA n=1 Tax=Actinomadura rubteroloni TaxID=1926885 RepID=A0A2P4UFJ8_9ACTN|nr:metalloregulator ArsR/SmtB family transcription factor [Actinomadura rubteroloni]POM23809.1 HTH-type transcriptional repressor CzrA [Actinomadura rubteroloni]
MSAVMYALQEEFARVAKALAAPSRLVLLDLLAQREHGVEELAAAAGMRVSNTSAQLKVLAASGLVTSRRSGTSVRYRVADHRVSLLAEQLKRVAVEVSPAAARAARAVLGPDARPVGRAELRDRLADGTAVVVDVRPAAEYAAGHIAGALSIPADELAERLAEVPDGAEVVAYCRGRYCVLSADAVAVLHAHGRPARMLDGGIAEWTADGLPTASAA